MLIEQIFPVFNKRKNLHIVDNLTFFNLLSVSMASKY